MNALIEAKLNAALAAPMTHVVATHYADGATKRHEVRSLAAAQNWAAGECSKIGKQLVNRETGKTVTVVSVTIEAL